MKFIKISHFEEKILQFKKLSYICTPQAQMVKLVDTPL